MLLPILDIVAFLIVNDLSVRYSSSNGFVYAVDDVNFDLEDGQSIGIAGESACGKSTLGLSIMRILSEISRATLTIATSPPLLSLMIDLDKDTGKTLSSLRL